MSVRVLFVEDNQDDVELQLRRLRDAGLVPQWDRVQSEEALRAALDDESWQVALVDYNIPGFSGLEALRLIAEVAPDVPAITVSGSIDEDTAVATVSAGAVDYVLKDNLTRLAPAVRRAIDGADLRRAHRRAAEAARLALFAVDHASLAVTTATADGTVIYLNDFACLAFGKDRGELVGKKVWEMEEHLRSDRWQAVWDEVVEHGATEFRIDRQGPDGGRLVLDITANYLKDAEVVISYGRDVTARVEAEERARASAAEYRRMVEMANEGIWAMDAEYRTTFVNARMAEMLGSAPDDIVGHVITDFMFEEDLGDHAAHLHDRREGLPGHYERRFRRADGSELWTLVSSVASADESGGFTGSFGMFTDITERRQADEALRAERANLAAIFESSPVPMLVLDAELNVVRFNRAALTLVRSDAGQLLEHHDGGGVQPGDVLGCAHAGDDPLGCGHSSECPLCPLRSGAVAALDGGSSLHGVDVRVDLVRGGETRTAWMRMGAEPMVMDGAPHVTVALDDITDRRRAEEALRESEELFRQFAGRIPGFVTIKDAGHRYVFLSALDGPDIPGGERPWEGRSPEELWPPAEAAHIHEVADQVLAGEVVNEIIEWPLAEEMRHLHVLHFPIPRGSGPPLVGGLSLDVTERVDAEEKVRRQAEQLRRTVEGAVLAMSHVVETRDPYTAGHERRVAELATAIGQEMGMDPAEVEGLRLGSLIHDIGKISVPAEILAKPGRLSAVEFNLIKQHAKAGFEILSVIDFGRPVAEMVLQHHERLDGSGYPNGLTADDLLPETCVLAVADVVEAMSSHRPYRAALGVEAALAEIREGAGTRYDAGVAAACVRVMEEQGFQFTP